MGQQGGGFSRGGGKAHGHCPMHVFVKKGNSSAGDKCQYLHMDASATPAEAGDGGEGGEQC